MALEEKRVIDKIEVVGGDTDWRHIQVRTKIIILKDGVEIASSYDRTTYSPDANVAAISDAEVKATCQLYLTEERKTAYLTANPIPATPSE